MEALSGVAALVAFALLAVLIILGILVPWFVYRTSVYTYKTWQAVERLEKRMERSVLR